jgi:site-specific DNA recombinase
MRVIIYTRVSLDREQKSRSVSEQEAEVRGWCERRGWTVVDVLCDNDRSASRYATKARPAYRQLVAAVQARDCDVVAAWESSRLGRTLEDYGELRTASATAGVVWLVGDRLLDMADLNDRFGATLDMAVNERTSDETSHRVRRRTAAAAKTGQPHGKLLYGYALEYLPDGTKRRVLDETTAPIVQEVARRIVKGETLYAVAQDLNNRGVIGPRGGIWNGTQVKRLCVNPGYAGRRVHQGKVVPGVQALWPRLIPENTYQALLRRLSDPARTTNGGSRGPVHFLTGVLICGVCDGPVHCGFNGGVDADGVRTRSYMCKQWHVSRSKQPLEAFLTAELLGRLMHPDVLEVLAEDQRAPGDRAAARQEALEAQARLDEWYAASAKGDVSPTALAAVEVRLLATIADAEARAAVPQVPTLLRAVAGPDAPRKWKGLSVEQKRELASMLMQPRILPVGKGKRVFDSASIDLVWTHAIPTQAVA